jgi:hypothetical protein
MRRTGILLLMMLTVLGASGQDYSENREISTIFGDRHISHGGYGAITINYSQIGKDENNKPIDAVVIGGRGSWVIGHAFALGIGGCGFVNDFHYNNTLRQWVNLSGGYGGLYFEPILLPRVPVHLSLPVLVGVGGVAYTSSYNLYDADESNIFVEDACPFLIVEPGVELEFNMVRCFRIAVGAYYRFTNDIQLEYTDPQVLTGLSIGITLKFGKF